MEYVVLIAILTVNFITLMSLIYAGSKIYRLYLSVSDFILPDSEGKPSKLALSSQAISEIFSTSIVNKLKTSFMGMQSGDNRQLKSLEGDIAEDIANQSPIGAILQSFPTLRKSLRKNPQLLDIAMGLLQSKLGNKLSGSGNGSGSNQQAQFRL